jgi:hypothetical protein
LRLQTDEALKQDKLTAQLVSFFGLLGLLLSCIGLYESWPIAVVRRTNEIGIRMAPGRRTQQHYLDDPQRKLRAGRYWDWRLVCRRRGARPNWSRTSFLG